MEASVAKLFTPEVLAEAARAFGAEPEGLELLGDFESYVYAFTAEGQARILRLTHPSHRSAGQMEAELHWVEFLAARGVRIARPVRSSRNELTYTVEQSPAVFHVCAFTRVPGRSVEEADFTPELFREWGSFLGRCHALTGQYETPPGWERRISWTDDPYIVNGRDWIPQADGFLRDLWSETFDEIRKLPRDPNSYGLCHTDLHLENFHLEDGRIHAFDTDDCAYQYFVEDLSSVFYYGSRHTGAGSDVQKFFAWAWPAFWKAYKREHPLGAEWLDQIHTFQTGRALTLFALLHMKFEPDSEERKTYLPRLRAALESDRPILDVEYRDLD